MRITHMQSLKTMYPPSYVGSRNTQVLININLYYIYKYKYSSRRSNMVLTIIAWLSPKWLCGNSSTWAHAVCDDVMYSELLNCI